MATVNYYYIDEIFTLLEVAEVADGVDFQKFDPNATSDIQTITTTFILPSVVSASLENRVKLQRTLAYYTTQKSAPFQEMRDDHQELSLYDPVSWSQFFKLVGEKLFGDEFERILLLDAITEEIDEEEGRQVFEFQ